MQAYVLWGLMVLLIVGTPFVLRAPVGRWRMRRKIRARLDKMCPPRTGRAA